jgi:DNA repair protein RadC
MTYQFVSERKKDYKGAVRTAFDAYSLVKRYGDSPKELFLVITLNGAHEPISVCIATIGLATKTIIHPREVFIRAIQDLASDIIICHNHPSGSLKASKDDEEITLRLREAGEIIGIQVIDHIIFSKDGFNSLRTEGLFKKKGEQ